MPLGVVGVADEVVAGDHARVGRRCSGRAAAAERRVIDVDAGIDDADLDAVAGQAPRVLATLAPVIVMAATRSGAARQPPPAPARQSLQPDRSP